MADKGVATALPKLPGYDFSALSQPATFAKSHGFDFYGGVAVVKSVKQQPVAANVGPNVWESAKFSEANILKHFPRWRTLDQKVLRFFGYFTERVPESPLETTRVRKITVSYYLSDNSLLVTETPTAPNHGMRAGTLMARHKDDAVTVAALAVGGTLALRGRAFSIVDCDAFTREFYEVMGLRQGEPLGYPGDAFESLTRKAGTGPRTSEFMAQKQAMEMSAAMVQGKPTNTLTRDEIVRTQAFLEHDREVLNFFATWEQRRFRVSFFIADRTMCVNSLKAPNDGRDPVANFIKRGRIPKGKFALKNIDTCSDAKGLTQEFFTEEDLATGKTISIYGREFFLYDCDAFTRQYYLDKLGVVLHPAEKGWTEGDPSAKAVRAVDLPPYNGFGSEEDSLGSFRQMVPKPPKKDYAKYINHASDVLRMSAELARPLPEEEGRKFIVCFYLADDTISVFEYALRNSGHTGGKTFARAKVPGVTAASMTEGNELKLGGLVYRLIKSDERTHNFLATGESMGQVRDTRAEDLLNRVRLALIQKFSRVTDAYRHFAGGRSGFGFAELKHMFRECEVKVDNADVMANVMALVDRDRDGVISLQEFVENVLKQSLAAPVDPPKVEDKPTAATYLDAERLRAKKDFANQVLKIFVAKLEARRAYIVDAFRIVSDRSVDGLIGVDTFRHVVTERLGLQLSPEEMDALVFRFFYVENLPDYTSRRLTLRDFRKVLES